MTDAEMNSIEAAVDKMLDMVEMRHNERPLEAYESVDHPSYYNGDECFDAMIQTQGTEAVKDFCICCAFKYLWRWRRKGGDEDIKKAKWYLEKYLELENMV